MGFQDSEATKATQYGSGFTHETKRKSFAPVLYLHESPLKMDNPTKFFDVGFVAKNLHYTFDLTLNEMIRFVSVIVSTIEEFEIRITFFVGQVPTVTHHTT